MTIPSPDLTAIRWKRAHMKVNGNEARFRQLIAADEARLTA